MPNSFNDFVKDFEPQYDEVFKAPYLNAVELATENGVINTDKLLAALPTYIYNSMFAVLASYDNWLRNHS